MKSSYFAYGLIFGMFIQGIFLGAIQEMAGYGSCKAATYIKIQQSPHEKQEEPRLASTTKIPEDERFIF